MEILMSFFSGSCTTGYRVYHGGGIEYSLFDDLPCDDVRQGISERTNQQMRCDLTVTKTFPFPVLPFITTSRSITIGDVSLESYRRFLECTTQSKTAIGFNQCAHLFGKIYSSVEEMHKDPRSKDQSPPVILDRLCPNR